RGGRAPSGRRERQPLPCAPAPARGASRFSRKGEAAPAFRLPREEWVRSGTKNRPALRARPKACNSDGARLLLQMRDSRVWAEADANRAWSGGKSPPRRSCWSPHLERRADKT